MAADHKPGTKRDGKPPEGSQPKDKSKRDDQQRRDQASTEGSGDSPMDPQDENFIESK